MYAIDANIVIYALEGNTEFGPDAKKLLNVLIKQAQCRASELLIMEVLSCKMEDSDARGLLKWLLRFDMPYDQVSLPVLLAAAKLRRKYSFGTPDSIHVASAMTAGCTHFITNDRTILKKKLPGIEIISLKKAAKLFA